MKPRPSDDESIEATAAAWLAEQDDGLSSEQTAEFTRWRAADPRHEAAVARLERAWQTLQPLRDFRPEAQRHPDRDLLGARPVRRARRARVWAASALVAASLAVAAVWWTAGRRDAAVERVYSTTVEGYGRITLADGSVAELNSDSEMAVRFTPGERHVRLGRGEAHFSVAKNPARPFVVEAGGVAVRAVGTAFNVRVGAREVEVLVTEGKVRVSRGAEPEPKAGGDTAPASGETTGAATLVAANERVLVAIAEPGAATPPRPQVERIAADAVREALAWQGPRLVFADTPLDEVIAQFNRRNAVQLELGDPALASLPIGGSFRAENVEAFVRLLVSGSDVAAERPDATHIVLRRAK